jgi:hypothetical protein
MSESADTMFQVINADMVSAFSNFGGKHTLSKTTFSMVCGAMNISTQYSPIRFLESRMPARPGRGQDFDSSATHRPFG